MGRNFDDYPGFQPFRSWANTYAQDCKTRYNDCRLESDLNRQYFCHGGCLSAPPHIDSQKRTLYVGLCCLESVHSSYGCQYYEVYTIFLSFNIYLKITLAVDYSQLIMLSQIVRCFRNRVNRF